MDVCWMNKWTNKDRNANFQANRLGCPFLIFYFCATANSVVGSWHIVGSQQTSVELIWMEGLCLCLLGSKVPLGRCADWIWWPWSPVQLYPSITRAHIPPWRLKLRHLMWEDFNTCSTKGHCHPLLWVRRQIWSLNIWMLLPPGV